MSLDVIETRMVGNPEIDVWNSKCFIAVILKESPNIMVVGIANIQQPRVWGDSDD